MQALPRVFIAAPEAVSASLSPNAPPNHKESKVPIIACWVLGTLFTLNGFVTLLESPLSAILNFVMAGFLLPPVRKFTGNKTGITISRPVRIIAICVLIFITGIIGNYEATTKENEQAKAGGFESVAVYQEAKQVGISTKTDYADHLEREKKDQETQRKEKVVTLEKTLASTQDPFSRMDILKELVNLEPTNTLYKVELVEAQGASKNSSPKVNAQGASDNTSSHRYDLSPELMDRARKRLEWGKMWR